MTTINSERFAEICSKVWLDRSAVLTGEAAAAEFKRAIEINPNNSEAHMLFSFYLAAVGRIDESLQAVRRARDFDPLSPIINAHVGTKLYFARRYDEGAEELKPALDTNPNLHVIRYGLGNIYERQGRYGEALAEYQKMPATNPILEYGHTVSHAFLHSHASRC